MHSISQGDEIFVGSEGVLNGEVGGVIPVEGALRVVVTVSAAAPAVGERFLDVGHSGIGGVVLNPTEFASGDEEVTTVAISEVVEDGGIASMEFAVSIHFLKDGLVLRPEIKPHFEEEGDFYLGRVSVLDGQVADGIDGHCEDPHVRVEDVEGVELKVKRGGPPLEMVPVVFVDSEVDEFFRSREVKGIVDRFFLVYFVTGERDGSGLDLDLSEVFDDVVEDL